VQATVVSYSPYHDIQHKVDSVAGNAQVSGILVADEMIVRLSISWRAGNIIACIVLQRYTAYMWRCCR
jgi:hypothetical protein